MFELQQHNLLLMRIAWVVRALKRVRLLRSESAFETAPAVNAKVRVFMPCFD